MPPIKFLTNDAAAALPRLYDTDDLPNDETPVIVKFFNPYGIGTWYICEYDPETHIAFGLCVLHEAELGYVNLLELANLRRKTQFDLEGDISKIDLTTLWCGRSDCPGGIERDIHFQPGSMTLQQVIDAIKEGKQP